MALIIFSAIFKPMTNFLLKTGMMLMFIAGVIIVSAFFVFAFFSMILLAPGLLLYNLGIRSIYNEMMQTGDMFFEDGIKTIEGSVESPTPDFVKKSKSFLKASIRKIRNFLNKYAD